MGDCASAFEDDCGELVVPDHVDIYIRINYGHSKLVSFRLQPPCAYQGSSSFP